MGWEIAKQYAPFLAVCQAGGSAEGKKYLDTRQRSAHDAAATDRAA